MAYPFIKSLHIIFVVTWFAGLFYIVRLYIYHAEANDKPEPERGILFKQFKHMERLLWYVITWPSAILTLILGVWSLIRMSAYFAETFMIVKLILVGILYLYHLSCHYIYRLLQKDNIKYTSTQLRIWNELPTVLLIAIVFLIVSKNTLDMVWGTVGFFAIIAALMVAIKIYKRLRESKS